MTSTVTPTGSHRDVTVTRLRTSGLTERPVTTGRLPIRSSESYTSLGSVAGHCRVQLQVEVKLVTVNHRRLSRHGHGRRR